MYSISSSPRQQALLTPAIPIRKEAGPTVSGATGSRLYKYKKPPDKVNRLSSILPSCLLDEVLDWLSKKDKFRLIQVGQPYYKLLQEHFNKRLNKDILKSRGQPCATSAFLYYHSPDLRRGRHLLSDQTGLNYLSQQGLYYPLTEGIRAEKITVGEAIQFRFQQTRAIASYLAEPGLTPKQKRFFRNCLFSEHIVSGRCCLSRAREMSACGTDLFYSMTLQHLFRTGRLKLEDLRNISNSGMSLLHDPQISHLYDKGWISKQQLLGLTPVQLNSILLCIPALARKQVSMATVLALQEKHVEFLQVSELAEQVRSGRITLKHALDKFQPKRSEVCSKDEVSTSVLPSSDQTRKGPKSSQENLRADTEEGRPLIVLPVLLSQDKISFLPLLSRDRSNFPETEYMPPLSHILCCSTHVQSRIDWIKLVGPIIITLPCDEIFRHLNYSSSNKYISIFERLHSGLGDHAKVAELTHAYLDLCIKLTKNLSCKDFLWVITPFISHDFGIIMAKSFTFNDIEIIRQCSMLWSLVRSSSLVAEEDIFTLWEQAVSSFETHIQDRLINSLSPAVIMAFAQLLRNMNLSCKTLLFDDWPAIWTTDSWDHRGADRTSIADHFQALMCPYEESNEAVANFLAAIDQRRCG